MGGPGSGRKTMRGVGISIPSVHLLWSESLRLRGSNLEVNEKKHSGHPTCRVTGGRKFACTRTVGEITCRGCLRAVALITLGEEKWRSRILRCAARILKTEKGNRR